VKLALQDNPLDAESHFLFGCLLERKGEPTRRSWRISVRWRSIQPTPTRSTTWGRCCCGGERRFRPPSRSRVPYRSAPITSRPYNNLAKAYFLAGLPELAVASYEEVLRRDSSNAIRAQ